MRRREFKKYMRHIIVFLLVFIMMSTTNIFLGANGNIALIDEGVCGENLTWTLDEAGCLIVKGTGRMWDMRKDENADYDNWMGTGLDVVEYDCPWEDYKDEIKTVILSSGVTSVGESAFKDCINLTNVEFSDTLTAIEVTAFYKCKSLQNFVLPKKLVYIGQQAFEGCETLTSVELPGSVSYVMGQVFNECTALSYLYAKGTTEIVTRTIYSSSPFGYMPKLEKIEVADNHQFWKSIDGVLYSKNGQELVEYPAGKKDSIYTVPAGTIKMGQCAFEKANALEMVVLPEGLLELGHSVF